MLAIWGFAVPPGRQRCSCGWSISCCQSLRGILLCHANGTLAQRNVRGYALRLLSAHPPAASCYSSPTLQSEPVPTSALTFNIPTFFSVHRPLRVGYISPDFFTHSVSYFSEAPLTHHHTPTRYGSSSGTAAVLPGGLVQHYAYCAAPKRDGKTQKLRAAVEGAGGVW